MCPCVVGQRCCLSKTDTILTPDYFRELSGLPGPSPTSWKGVPPPPSTAGLSCVCGRTFESGFALTIHAASQPGGTLHDWPPECRPRLGGASILIDATNPNPYGAVIAACAARFTSRSLHHESSTSSEIRQYAAALEEFRDLIPDGYEVLLSTDSESGRALQKTHNDRTKSARHTVRTPEVGELRRGRYPRDSLRERGVDLISAHEGAAHNRRRKGTSDGLLTVTSRGNHGCDLAAGAGALEGRDVEERFYSAGEPQLHCTYYFTNSGKPLLGDVFDEAGLVADRIQMARLLQHEKRQPHGSRAKCTHIARLAECGDADMVLTAKLWDRLPPHTHAEAQRILLGAQLTSCRNLCNLKPCEDGDFIRDTVSALIGQGRECLFCKAPRGSRTHWCHECPASRSELEQKERNVAASLAYMGYCFWFDPLAR